MWSGDGWGNLRRRCLGSGGEQNPEGMQGTILSNPHADLGLETRTCNSLKTVLREGVREKGQGQNWLAAAHQEQGRGPPSGGRLHTSPQFPPARTGSHQLPPRALGSGVWGQDGRPASPCLSGGRTRCQEKSEEKGCLETPWGQQRGMKPGLRSQYLAGVGHPGSD